MTTYGKCEDIISLVVNPSGIFPELPVDKLRLLKIESESMLEDYNRDIAINFIAGNFTSNKHLCSTVLSGKDDVAIKEIIEDLIEKIVEENNARKNNS